MSTSALTTDPTYKRVIAARFVTKFDKVTPIPCTTCDAPLVMGQAFAALRTDGGWDSYCATCAGSERSQLAGLIQVLSARGITITGPAQDAVIAYSGGSGKFLAARSALQALLAGVVAAAAEQAKAEIIAGLADDEDYAGLALFVQYCSARDREFATSLLSQWENRGSLSERQMVYAVKFATKGHKLAAAAEPDPDVEPGLYIDGQVVTRIYTRSHRLLARTFNGTTFNTDVTGVRRVFKGLALGTIRLLTGDEARAYGRQHQRCFNCLSIGRPGELSDDRSIAAGYGETCADNNGWWYPTAEQAAEILRGGCQH